MDLITPNPGLIVWMIIIFGVLFFLLSKFAWKPILSSLKERNENIDSALKMAEETRAEMAKLKSDNEAEKAEARKERDLIIKQAKEASERLIIEAKAKAVNESTKIMNDAREAIKQERVAMTAQIKEDMAKFSIEIAEKVIRRELADKKSQQTFVSELIADTKLN
jgi:F-type H+-transporting ATPase subunit b